MISVPRLGLKVGQLDEIQKIPFQKLQEAFWQRPGIQGLAGGVVVDGKSLPADPWFPAAP